MNALPPLSFPALPWTTADLLTHLWQSTAVALVVLVLLTGCGRLPANTRRLLGWMALLKFALPMALVAQLLAGKGVMPDSPPGPRVLMLPAGWSSTVFSARTDAIAPARNVTGIFVTTVWFAGSAALLGMWIVRGLRLRRVMLKNVRLNSPAMRERIEAAAARAGVQTLPRCLLGATDHGPGMLGILSPILILPAGLEETLSPAELEAVLIHEFIHLRRRDNLWSTAQALFGCLFWFHPLVVRLNRHITLETEKSCDEQVLDITGDPDTYAGGILKSVRHALGLAQPGFAGVTTPPVVERISSILAYGTHRKLPIVRTAALAAGASLLALSGYAGSFASAPSLSDAATPTSIASKDTISNAMAAANPAAVAALPSPVSPSAPPIFATAGETAFRTGNSSVDADPASSANPADRIAPSSAPISTPASADAAQVVTNPGERETPSEPEMEKKAPLNAVVILTGTNETVDEVAKSVPVPAASPKVAAIQVFDIKNLDQMPVVKSRTSPIYPLYLRRIEMSGQVLVDFIVDTNGDVRDAYAVRPANRDFGLSAVEAVSQWKFQPGTKRGRMVDTHMQVPIIFAFHKD